MPKVKNKTLVIGLTGGIASGKSSVARVLKKLGARIIDADKISRSILVRGKPAYKKVLKLFGNIITDRKKNIDRKKLAGIVFFNPKLRGSLEKITHPQIIAKINKEIKRSSSKPVLVIDAPLLFEAGLQKTVDKTIVVWAPREAQKARLRARDDLNLRQINARIDSQLSLEKKKRLADHVIDNSRDIAALKLNTKKLWRLLTKSFKLL
jgi:dephospho-CoA kinase